ncbi:MAG: hypothetical protein IIC67_00450 [Thaumarchaeota archaeon]|nr:hypothetical protein [Nitrososphaerota archaeon]
MGSQTVDVNSSVEDTFSKVQQAIGTENYKVTTLDPNRSIFAEGSRDFSWIIMIVLILLIWPIALVYYFTRQRSSVTITVTPNSDGDANFGCRVNINSNGNSGERILQTLVSILR